MVGGAGLPFWLVGLRWLTATGISLGTALLVFLITIISHHVNMLR
jgi:hypothetical protein